MESFEPQRQQRLFPCKQCGANLTFAPGQSVLKCPYCQHENAIEVSAAPVQELDFAVALRTMRDSADTTESMTVKCGACGAQTTLAPNVTAGACAFCGSAIVAHAESTRKIKPRSLLPFHVDAQAAMKLFREWVASRWFAPGDLKRLASTGKINGVYIPYWTYDCDTWTQYVGERGEHYWTTETYTTMENGQMVTKTRQVQKTRWYPASGTVDDSFDDILVLASTTLPRKYTEKLEPWDLQNLVPYGDEFLAGFVAESYQIDLDEGFDVAKGKMEPTIHGSIRSDIGGDEQRILSTSTRYDHVTFKHVLLPLWISAYRYRDRAFRFLVNARTGEVTGERPWSALKITALVVLIAAVIALVAFLARGH